VAGHIRKAILTFGQFFVVQSQSSAIIKQNFHPVFSLVIENKKMPGENGFCELLADKSRKAVVGSPHVGWSACHENLEELGKNMIRPSQGRRQAPRDIEEGEVARTEESRLLVVNPRQQKRHLESFERSSQEREGNFEQTPLEGEK
jgi:hypothetical protein